MALDYNFCKVGVTEDCSNFFFEDKTVYGAVGSGEQRTDKAHYLVGFDYVVEEEDLPIEGINNDDPINTITWEIPSTRDGYSYFDILVIDSWLSSNDGTNSKAYVVGDITYSNGLYWLCILNHNNQEPSNDINNVFWVEIPEEELYDKKDDTNTNLQPAMEVIRQDILNLCRAYICYGEVVTNAAENCCDDCTEQNNKDFVRVDVLLQGATLLQAQTKYVEAHKVAALLSDVCNDLSDCGCS